MTAHMPCPCQSGFTYEDCCAPLLARQVFADSPERLMRSRYTAYVNADIDYLRDTTADHRRAVYDFEQLGEWARQSQWLGLKVHVSEQEGDRGRVVFTARFKLDDGVHAHTEDSTFMQQNGRWYFVEGQECAEPKSNVGRNDPCLCGSGRKYKKCCGAGV